MTSCTLCKKTNMFVYVHEHTFLLVCAGSRRVSGSVMSFSSLSAYYFLRQGLSLTPGFTFSSIMLEVSKAQQSCLCLHSELQSEESGQTPGLVLGCWDLNSGFHDFASSALNQ